MLPSLRSETRDARCDDDIRKAPSPSQEPLLETLLSSSGPLSGSDFYDSTFQAIFEKSFAFQITTIMLTMLFSSLGIILRQDEASRSAYLFLVCDLHPLHPSNQYLLFP